MSLSVMFERGIMNLDAICLLQGIDELEFGMERTSIIATLGNEYSEEIDESGDVKIEYSKFGLEFTFWSDEGFRLGVISTERDTSTLHEKCLIGKSKEDLKLFIKEELNGVISEEDGCEHEDGHIQEWIEVDSHSVSFWFRNDALYQIDWMCDWVDDETPKWPAKKT